MKKTNALFVVDSCNKLLVVHPTGAPHTSWGVPKGLGDHNETSYESAIRETLEETNLDITKYNIANYVHLGEMKYKSNKKTIEGHFVKINEPLSQMNLDLKCTSYIDNTNIPECDEIKWIHILDYHSYLHEAQTRLLHNHLN